MCFIQSGAKNDKVWRNICGTSNLSYIAFFSKINWHKSNKISLKK
jgi:hypothetical protein